MASTISAGTSAGTAIAITGDTTGNLAFQTSAGTYTQTMPNATGTVMVSGNMPAFSAYRSGTNQSLVTATFTKVQLNTEEFDTNNNFDSTTNYRFTPTIAGYYQISGSVGLNGTNTRLLASIYKNGTEYLRGIDGSVNLTQAIISALIYFNGSTDYVELYVYATFAGTSDITSGQKYNYLTGSMVRAA